MRLVLLFLPMFLFSFEQVAFIKSDASSATLVNSVSFHPHKDLFCVTYTHQNQVGLYQIDSEGRAQLMQMLTNPKAHLDSPQNAIFSPDGQYLFVVNWQTCHFNVYTFNVKKGISSVPKWTIPIQLSDPGLHPHGMAFSSDGKYLAVVYGSFDDAPWMVALYRVTGLGTDQIRLAQCSTLEKSRYLQGVPKGVAFSPDGSCLAITFTVTNSIDIFPIDWATATISPWPIDEITGLFSQLYRPEDIVFSPDGSYCIVSNSDKNTVSFHQFDRKCNSFSSDAPFKVIDHLHFPHGLSFSRNGRYLAITQFGAIQLTSAGYIDAWGDERSEGVALFKAN